MKLFAIKEKRFEWIDSERSYREDGTKIGFVKVFTTIDEAKAAKEEMEQNRFRMDPSTIYYINDKNTYLYKNRDNLIHQVKYFYDKQLERWKITLDITNQNWISNIGSLSIPSQISDHDLYHFRSLIKFEFYLLEEIDSSSDEINLFQLEVNHDFYDYQIGYNFEMFLAKELVQNQSIFITKKEANDAMVIKFCEIIFDITYYYDEKHALEANSKYTYLKGLKGTLEEISNRPSDLKLFLKKSEWFHFFQDKNCIGLQKEYSGLAKPSDLFKKGKVLLEFLKILPYTIVRKEKIQI